MEKTYSKSTVIASGVTGTSFNDEHCWEEGTFYYWVVPVDSTGKSFYSKSKYRAGRAVLSVKVGGSSSLTVGESEQYQVLLMCSLLSGKYKWKIVSGTKYATISATGVLKAKKAGKVVIQCTRQVGLVEERPDIVIQMHTVNALVADALSGEKRESPAAFDYGL